MKSQSVATSCKRKRATSKTVSSHASLALCSDGTSFGLLHHGFADAGWEWQRALELAQERQKNKKVDQVIKGREPADYNEFPFRWVATDPAEDENVDNEQPENPLIDRPKASTAHPGSVEPRQQEKEEDRAEHGNDAGELRRDKKEVRNGAKKRTSVMHGQSLPKSANPKGLLDWCGSQIRS